MFADAQARAPIEAPPAGAAEPAGKLATWRLGFRFNKDVLVNGSNPLLLLDELRGLGECRVTVHCDRVPPLAEMEPDACYLEWEAVLTMAHPRSAIDDVFMFVADDMELKVEAVDAAEAVASRQAVEGVEAAAPRSPPGCRRRGAARRRRMPTMPAQPPRRRPSAPAAWRPRPSAFRRNGWTK